MPIPFFSKEDNLTAYKKMKVVFLIKKLRFIDFCLLLTCIFPFLLNLVIFGIIAGCNDVWKFFSPLGSFLKSVSDIEKNEWTTWYGSIHMVAIGLSIFSRFWFSWKLLSKMFEYKKEHPSFDWNKKDKFWLVVCLPFISFVIYPILVKMTKFELSHKYNL